MFAGVTDLISGHVQYQGHCWQLNTNSQAAAEDINQKLSAKGIDLEHGPCHDHGKAIHTWHHDDVTVKEFGAGESQDTPFTMLAQMSYIHNTKNEYGNCVSILASPSSNDYYLKSSDDHGTFDWQHGPCPNQGENTDCKFWAGVGNICQRPGSGAANMDITKDIELDAIHAEHKGVCYDADGKTKAIDDLRAAAKAHGITVHDGKCAKQAECRHWRNLKVCRSVKGGAWGGDEDIHAIDHKGHCLQLSGAALKNAKVDSMIASHAKAHGWDVAEGNCHSAGYDNRVWHKDYKKDGHNVHVSVWMH